MPEISIRKENGGTPEKVPAAYREWEPFRAMRELMRWDPFAEMMPTWFGEPTGGYTPAFDVKETNEAFIFKADLPGVLEKDLEIKVTNNRLSVTGKREEEKREKGESYYTYERSYGSFTRAFTLPEGVDAEGIKAELKGGVLTLSVPKKPEAQPRKIAVKNG